MKVTSRIKVTYVTIVKISLLAKRNSLITDKSHFASESYFNYCF